jgi:hypothetical protein
VTPLSHSPSEWRSTSPNRARITASLELPCRRIAGAGKRHSARVFERQRASPAFRYDWTHNLTSFTRLKVAFRIPIKCDDDMIGDWQCQAGFKLSAEDLPVRLSATTS